MRTMLLEAGNLLPRHLPVLPWRTVSAKLGGTVGTRQRQAIP